VNEFLEKDNYLSAGEILSQLDEFYSYLDLKIIKEFQEVIAENLRNKIKKLED
jgi:hypothetical protein